MHHLPQPGRFGFVLIIIANTLVPMPPKALGILRRCNTDFAHLQNGGVWKAARAALLLDPQADVRIE